MEWNDLHIKLSEILGDPFTTEGAPISFDTDGVRYSAAYRSRLLNDSLRWVLMNFDPVYLLQNGIPCGMVITEYGSLTNKVMRLLSVELREETESGAVITSVPIVTRTTKRLNRLHHSHWGSTPYAYLYDRYNVQIENIPNNAMPMITYVADFDDVTSDDELIIPKTLQDYVLMRAVVREKVNSQKYQEGMYLGKTVDGSVQTTKQIIEQTKQSAYLK